MVLFDLDGVLTRKDTMAAMVAGRLAKRPWLWPVALVLVLLAQVSSSQGRLRPAAHRALVRLAFLRIDEDGFTVIAQRFGRRFVEDDRVVRAAVDECLARTKAGQQVIVVTASERRTARAVLDACGLEAVRLLASEVTHKRDGMALTEHNIGQAKVCSLRAAGVLVEEATFFTDSASDAPLARRVALTIAATAKPRDRAVLARVARRFEVSPWG